MPNSTDSVQEQINEISSKLKEVMSRYIGRSNVTPFTLASIAHDIAAAMPSMTADDQNIQFTAGKHPGEVVPANLYTTLRMHLGDAAPSFADCESGVYTAPNGVVYEWKDGGTTVRVPTPMHTITFNVTEMKS